ncbi:MAG: V-type ATP synthase subunit E [Tissierellia bacterium]|nr:V-type ATP synthase subunit E [Tissierellia bacterium]MDD4436622.1 V-type ATP synthase subunit E [Tissierellia bacterium]
MVTIEQKLELFRKLLNQSMYLKIEEELNKLEKEVQIKTKQTEEKIDKTAQEIVDRAAKKAELRHAEITGQSQIAMKREIMSIKEKYFDIFMNNFKDRLQVFVQSNEYKAFLYKNILKLNNELNKYGKLDLIIYLSAKDLNKYGDFIKTEIAKNHTVSLTAFDIIGGFITEVPSKNIKFDLSIDTILEDNKAYIMQTLFEALKAGEHND